MERAESGVMWLTYRAFFTKYMEVVSWCSRWLRDLGSWVQEFPAGLAMQ